jgi:hypothetical protein
MQISTLAPKPAPAAAFSIAADNIDHGTNLIANADSGAVWGTPGAKPYIDGVHERFTAAADALDAAHQALSPAEVQKIDDAGLNFQLDSLRKYTRDIGSEHGIVDRFNTKNDPLFGGVTAVAFALSMAQGADNARAAAELLGVTPTPF